MDKTFDEVFRAAGEEAAVEKEIKLDSRDRVEMFMKGKKVFMRVYKNGKLVKVGPAS